MEGGGGGGYGVYVPAFQGYWNLILCSTAVLADTPPLLSFFSQPCHLTSKIWSNNGHSFCTCMMITHFCALSFYTDILKKEREEENKT